MADEQVRLFASYLNIVAVGALVAALVTEPFAWSPATAPRSLSGAPFVLISFALSIAFHAIAQMTLRSLDGPRS